MSGETANEPIPKQHLTYCWKCLRATGTQIMVDDSGIGKYEGTWTLGHCSVCRAVKSIEFVDSNGKYHNKTE